MTAKVKYLHTKNHEADKKFKLDICLLILTNDGSLLLWQQFCCADIFLTGKLVLKALLSRQTFRLLGHVFWAWPGLFRIHSFMVLCLLHDFGKFSLLLVTSVIFFYFFNNFHLRLNEISEREWLPAYLPLQASFSLLIPLSWTFSLHDLGFWTFFTILLRSRKIQWPMQYWSY